MKIILDAEIIAQDKGTLIPALKSTIRCCKEGKAIVLPSDKAKDGNFAVELTVESFDGKNCQCGKPAIRECKDTPSGGWGTMKCGKPLCLECKCDCKDVLVY